MLIQPTKNKINATHTYHRRNRIPWIRLFVIRSNACVPIKTTYNPSTQGTIG